MSKIIINSFDAKQINVRFILNVKIFDRKRIVNKSLIAKGDVNNHPPLGKVETC